ncbi:type II and III secretion system protein family protein [Lichenihabitans psoromatis]|uniref:type II and III secretion system protein family protein n=1 Tax=Lichenihabitans psoromatis TaxID=2528642 RepID=UPI0010358EA3|nr:type II and III secretion system protein family protein [Lichenihabitans psoromatis]
MRHVRTIDIKPLERGRREQTIARYLLALLAMLVLAATAPAAALAQAAAPPSTVTASRTIHIDVSGGQLLRLPEAAGTEFVADPTIADIQSPKASSIFVFGKKPGRTTLFVLSQDGAPLLAYMIDVRFPQGELQAQMNADAGDAATRLTYTPNGAMLQGTVPDPQTAERLQQTATRTLGAGVPLTNQLQVAGSPQVNLRVRVAEVSRTVSRQLGFNWSTVFSAGDFAFGLQTGRLAGATGANLIANGVNGVFGTVASKHANGSAVLDAMAAEGLVTLLAEPNLTAVSGTTATFLAGGEFPIPIPQALGAVSVEYKQYGVSVAFTPTVLSSGHISVKVRPEVSALDLTNTVTLNNVQVPALTTRRAETTVELASGQSFAIAGLIQNNNNNSIQKLPWLGDIPILGGLFRSNQFQRNQSELVIVVTPYVVRPTGPGNPPGDASRYVRVPSDEEEVVYGRVAAPTRRAVGLARRAPPPQPENMGFVFQ